MKRNHYLVVSGKLNLLRTVKCALTVTLGTSGNFRYGFIGSEPNVNYSEIFPVTNYALNNSWVVKFQLSGVQISLRFGQLLKGYIISVKIGTNYDLLTFFAS